MSEPLVCLLAEFCSEDPPQIKYATHKAHTYKNGTLLACECKRGFRRIHNEYIVCTASPGHASWENKCRCISTGPGSPKKPVTPPPEGQEESKPTEMERQVVSLEQANLPGQCGEPPSWEHEAIEKTYFFMVGQTIQYQCLEGYRVQQRGRAESTCRLICGKARWTQPRLTCTKDTGKEEAESSTDVLPEGEPSCPSITTVSQKHTEVVTTMETFIVTTWYEIAVASCVFLLLSILLLSGLTWWQKWRKRRTII
ncbi:interleukin-2 receptor subunit alpha [Echinops telfairi]|uniref:Interleukin-2 receptor subunit alpha n=1 Tax=Echinops telfairi TaxID=9371 RepID=A0AC55CQP9_ECHTE|nr:interleukin-2 receptor subunit alpha [Echinops telfairi]